MRQCAAAQPEDERVLRSGVGQHQWPVAWAEITVAYDDRLDDAFDQECSLPLVLTDPDVRNELEVGLTYCGAGTS